MKEATMKVLSEGKVVNNKPYFDSYYSGGEPTGKKVRPGRYLSVDGYNDWDLRGNAKSRGIEQKFVSPEQDEYRKTHKGDDFDFDELDALPKTDYVNLRDAMRKHNDRIKNYKLNGHRYSSENDRYATLWGSKEAEDELAKDRAKERQRKLGRLPRDNWHRYDRPDSPGRLMFNDYGEFMGVTD